MARELTRRRKAPTASHTARPTPTLRPNKLQEAGKKAAAILPGAQSCGEEGLRSYWQYCLTSTADSRGLFGFTHDVQSFTSPCLSLRGFLAFAPGSAGAVGWFGYCDRR
jgi:hypothetical protein